MMADNKTPENDKTVSKTGDEDAALKEGPTPKNDKKGFGAQRSVLETRVRTSPVN